MSIYFSNIIDPDGGPHTDLIEVAYLDPTLAIFHEVKHATKEWSQQENHQPQHSRTDEKRKTSTEAGRGNSPIPGQKAK